MASERMTEGQLELRPTVLWFAEQMESKLKSNDHKGHWSNCDFPYLDRRLDEEVSELKVARTRISRPYTERTAAAVQVVISEAADVANFAMMIADNARALSASVAPPASPGVSPVVRFHEPALLDELERLRALLAEALKIRDDAQAEGMVTEALYERTDAWVEKARAALEAR